MQLPGITRGWQGWDCSSLGVPRAGDGQTDLFDCELEPCAMGGPGTIPGGPAGPLCRAFLLTPCLSSAGTPGGRTASLHSSIQLWVFFFSVFFLVFVFLLSSSLYMFGVFVCVCVRSTENQGEINPQPIPELSWRHPWPGRMRDLGGSGVGTRPQGAVFRGSSFG